MKKLLNTLYVLTPDSYLFCRNENICVRIGDMEKLSVPALNIESIVCCGKMTVAAPDHSACVRSQGFASATGSGCRIPCLRFCWIPRSWLH